MPDFLTSALQPAPEPILLVLVRLAAAMVLGGVVTAVYRFTRAADETAPSFAVTLVLLAVLIAMVTQVIGDNVARAFSLVGALSIVRFRTVVRDTQDTAYVIFAVAVGMAVGAGHLALAVSGIAVIAIAATVMKRGVVPPRGAAAPGPYVLKVRLGTGHDAGAVLGPVLDSYLQARHLITIETAKQGMALDLSYRAALRGEASAEELVKALNRVEGVQAISLQRMEAIEE
jgi:uncharacterized membrane protein YhiD involved in acid resistance